MKKLLEFKCDTAIGADPDVAASIVWYVIKKGGQDMHLHMTEVRIVLKSVYVELDVSDLMPEDAQAKYVEMAGQMLIGAIAAGVREGSVRVHGGGG